MPLIETATPLSLGSSEAERGVLGCCLLDPSKIAEAEAAGVSVSHFTEIRNQALWDHLRGQSAQEPVALVYRLGKLPDSEFGGRAYMSELQDGVPSAESLPLYLDDLQKCHVKRDVYLKCQQAMHLLGDPGADPGTIASGLAAGIGSIGVKNSSAFPAIQNGCDLMAASSAPLPGEVVKGILHCGCKMILGGSSKSKKTWAQLDLAMSVATGQPFWGFETIQGRVLYINFEIPAPFMRERLLALCRAKGIAQADLSNLDIWNLRGHALPAGAIVQQLVAGMKSRSYVLSIIDPIYKLAAGKDENSAGAMGELVGQLEKIPVQTGAALEYAHHFSKGNQANKESMDRVSGSGVFARDCDTMLTMTKHETEDAFTVEMTLRNHPEQAPFVVKWKYPLFERANLDPAKLKQAKGKPATFTVKSIVDVLGDQQLTHSAWLKQCEKNIGISKPTFNRVLQQAKSQKAVEFQKSNDKYSKPSQTSLKVS